MPPAIAKRLIIGFGSESGNARALAQQLAALPGLQSFSPQALPLNEVNLAAWDAQDVLVILSSSFGDGEPPANAEGFLANVQQAQALPGLRYALFGLGDTGYPQFCGFTKKLDGTLQQRGAQPLLHRVDADACYPAFFAQWAPVLQAVLQGQPHAGQDLKLQVKAYGEENAYAARILECRQLNQGAPGAFHVRLASEGSGMHWRAGDTLHVLPENDPALLDAIAQWYGEPAAADLLRHKELRQISKTVLRELARASGHERLKTLLKFSQRKELEAYLWGADLLDLLQDFCTPAQLPLAELAELLSPRLPRAYSIASHGQAGHLDLCIREVQHERQGRQRYGMATRWLRASPPAVKVYCRSNPGFHLPADAQAPLLLIGTGTGIAPLMGLLREMQHSGQQRRTCLIFGEKQRACDFLYEDELTALHQQGQLRTLITAFSRDGQSKYYVQHAIADHALHIRQLLTDGAHIYLCGNKAHLEDAIAQAINALDEASQTDAEADTQTQTLWQRLQAQGRLHQELY